MPQSTKPTATIFYSWQSDLPNSTNRGFIERCLERAINELGREGELQVDPSLTRDTEGAMGAVDIADEIYLKIDRCHVFVADVSIINKCAKIGEEDCRPTPNPNVLLELGYAVHRLDWGGVIPILNLESGDVEDLPFDLRKRRVLTYSLAEGAEQAARDEQRKGLVSAIKRELPKLLTDIPSPVQVEVFFYDRKKATAVGPRLSVKAVRIEGVDRASLPDYGGDNSEPYTDGHYKLVLGGTPNREYYREFFDWIRLYMSTTRVTIGLRNNGSSLLNGVKVLTEDAGSAGIILGEDVDSGRPAREIHPAMQIDPIPRPPNQGDVEVRSGNLLIEFGKLRRGERVVSDDFWLGTNESGEHAVNLMMLSDEHAPQLLRLTIDSEVKVNHLTPEEFMAWLEGQESDSETKN